jgi:hypothetical protein
MKMVRIRTRTGEVRICGLAPYGDLPSWWHQTRFNGAIVGSAWCLPFDEIAAADLIDAADGPDDIVRRHTEALHDRQADEIGRTAAAIGAGLWRPPGESI